jgi:site-specific DNA-methyltransferase (adenine-specific)
VLSVSGGDEDQRLLLLKHEEGYSCGVEEAGMEIDVIHVGDSAEVLKLLPNSCIDLTVTSPPYDNLRAYNGFAFDFETIANQLFRITKSGGVVVWVVGDATVKGTETLTSFRQALYFQSFGFNVHDTMIYRKINPIPLTHNRYEQHFEYMFVFSKGAPRVFNPILEECKTSGSYTRRRNTGRVAEGATRNRDETTVTKEKKYKGNIWEYVVGSKKGETGNHPAPFPEALASDHIISWSNEGDVVLDCFSGSGTTLKMAKLLNRHYIGIDTSAEYVALANDRLNKLEGMERLAA